MSPNSDSFSLILDQFQRSYDHAYQKNQFETTREIISSIEEILNQALNTGKNDEIIEKILSSGLHGSFLVKILRITVSRIEYTEEKRLLASFIRNMCHAFFYRDNISSQYIERIIPKSLFDFFQIVIDANDFEFFESLINEFTMLSLKSEPGELSYQIMSDLLLETVSNKNMEPLAYKIGFAITADGVNTPSDVSTLYGMLDEYQRLLTENYPTVENSQFIEKISNLKKEILEIFILSRVYEAFFWIGSYILFKGAEYTRYLNTLWYITQPKEGGGINFVNRPPVAEDVTWLATTLLKQNEMDRSRGPYFGDYQSPLPFMYKYFAILLQKSKNDFHFPSRMDLNILANQDSNQILPKWSGLCSRLRSENFVKFTKNLDGYVDLNHLFEEENVKQKIFAKIENLQNNAKTIETLIMEIAPLVPEKIKEFVSDAINSYYGISRMEKLSTVKFSTTHMNESKVLSQQLVIENDIFQGKEGVGYFFPFDDLGRELASFEENVLLSEVKKQSEVVSLRYSQFVSDLEQIYNDMKNAKHEASLVFINPRLLRKYWEKKRNYDVNMNILDNLIPTVTFNKLSENEFFLIDKHVLETTYLLFDKERAKLSINKDDKNPRNALIQIQMEIKPTVLDFTGITKIHVQGLAES